MTDEELFTRYRDDNDQDAFAIVMQRNWGPLVNYLRKKVRDEAEDVAQHTFLKVHQLRDRYNGNRFRSWLFTIASNRAIDVMRKRQMSTRPNCDRQVTPPDFDFLEVERFQEAMDTLPEMFRTPLYQVHFQGLQYAEVARNMGIPEGTVRSRLHSALHKLRDRCNAA